MGYSFKHGWQPPATTKEHNMIDPVSFHADSMTMEDGTPAYYVYMRNGTGTTDVTSTPDRAVACELANTLTTVAEVFAKVSAEQARSLRAAIELECRPGRT